MVSAVLAAVLLIILDRVLAGRDVTLAFAGGADSARSLLSTIAASMVTLTTLVFSITVVVLQLASSQYSPRAQRGFLRDRQNQVTLGIFLGSFVYALVVLREVRGGSGGGEEFVPGAAVTGAFLMVLASAFLFVQYINHISQAMRAVTIIEDIGDEARRTLTKLHPEAFPDQHEAALAASPQGPPDAEVKATAPGIVAHLDIGHLVEVAERCDAVARVVPRVGDFVATGMPLVRLWVAGSDEVDTRAVRACITLASERDSRQDVAFGIRQLVDIAERALSPGINDPSTAAICMDQIHDLLRRLATCGEIPTVHADGTGEIRVLLAWPTWDDYVGLAFDELRNWSAPSLQARRRLQSMLDDLKGVVPPHRRGPLEAREPLWNEPIGA